MSVSVLVAGDYCPRERINELIAAENYDLIFGQVKRIIDQCDYSIVNFECPVRVTEGEGIKKAGPSLKCSAKAVDALKYAGFKCVTLANNHFYDQGEAGVEETIQTVSDAGIAYVGGGTNLEEAGKTLYQTVKDKTIAIINCCEHEFSIATKMTGGSNPLNLVQQYYAIKEARNKADFVLVIIHGGIEHFQYPSPRMVETYRFFVDAGADAVINHHQHCFSGAEVWHGKPIFYGLGNFCFDWQKKSNELWNEGYMVILELSDGKIDYHLLPYIQNSDTPGVQMKDNIEYSEWKTRFDGISEIIAEADKLQACYDVLLSETERKYSANIMPYSGRITLALYMRRLLPVMMSKQKMRVLLNMLMCESHYDRMLHMLRNYSK